MCDQDVKAKRSPYLVPCSLLDERSRRLGRDGVREAVCTLLAYGYSLEPLNQERGMSQSPVPSYSSVNTPFNQLQDNTIQVGTQLSFFIE